MTDADSYETWLLQCFTPIFYIDNAGINSCKLDVKCYFILKDSVLFSWQHSAFSTSVISEMLFSAHSRRRLCALCSTSRNTALRTKSTGALTKIMHFVQLGFWDAFQQTNASYQWFDEGGLGDCFRQHIRKSNLACVLHNNDKRIIIRQVQLDCKTTIARMQSAGYRGVWYGMYDAHYDTVMTGEWWLSVEPQLKHSHYLANLTDWERVTVSCTEHAAAD